MPDNHMHNGLYREYRKAKEEKMRQDNYRKRYVVPENRPLIINSTKNTSVKVLSCVLDWLRKAGKAVLYLAFFFLASAGLTALLNHPTREFIINLFTNLFH